MDRSKILFGEMQAAQKQPLILTLRVDAKSQAFFDQLRQQYFPPERNFLKAHLTLFHQLPDVEVTHQYLSSLRIAPFKLQVTGLKNLGGGVAYRVESADLMHIHHEISKLFFGVLIAQDKQGFRPHIVVQNKVLPEKAKELLGQLEAKFEPFEIQASDLDLWRYLGGPWEFVRYYSFK
jgi:2'-5' RNA ligase